MGELTCNYNFEVCYFATEFNCDIDNVIELMKSDNKFRTIYFNYQGKFTIVGGVFYFGDRFSVNLTLENKGMFVEFLKPYICIKNEDKIAELLKLDSSIVQFCNSLMYDNSGGGVIIFSGLNDNVRVKKFIKCLDLLIEDKTK